MSTQTEQSDARPGFAGSRLYDFVRGIKGLDPRLGQVFVPWALRNSRYVPSMVRLARAHVYTHKLRARAQQDGIEVPPFLILSVTSRCNLRCTGCYAGAVGTVANAPAHPGLGVADWASLVEEAAALGVVGFIIAGGEPFLLPGLVELFRAHPDRLFVVFTNGTALRPSDYETLRHCTNTVVVVSVEGDRDLTDHRRGQGVFEKALGALDRLRSAGVLTGISVTVGPSNVEYWIDSRNMDGLLAHSGPLAFFIGQIPTAGCEGGEFLTPEQRQRFRETVVAHRERATGGVYIIHSPEDEELLGGCVSAGRGFVHVTPAGDVTACPMSALATHNVKTASLSEALASPLFKMIRDNGHLLETEGHPCGLSAHASELESMVNGLGAYRTAIPEQVAAKADSVVRLG